MGAREIQKQRGRGRGDRPYDLHEIMIKFDRGTAEMRRSALSSDIRRGLRRKKKPIFAHIYYMFIVL